MMTKEAKKKEKEETTMWRAGRVTKRGARE
jgi:hypothetical protein